jgi:hypothetical protein
MKACGGDPVAGSVDPEGSSVLLPVLVGAALLGESPEDVPLLVVGSRGSTTADEYL